jgi:hypothetical protein
MRMHIYAHIPLQVDAHPGAQCTITNNGCKNTASALHLSHVDITYAELLNFTTGHIIY